MKTGFKYFVFFMQSIIDPPILSFEYAYTNYAAHLYGMIFHSIQSPAISNTILEDVFTRINYRSLNISTVYRKLVCKTRQLSSIISSNIKSNPAQYKNNHQYISNSPEITSEQLLKLVLFGQI